MAPIFVEMKASIGEFKAKMGEAAEEIEHLSKKGTGGYDKLQTVGKAALLGLGGIAVSAGAISVKAALEGEAAHTRLAQAIHNAGGSMEELEPRVKTLSGHFANLGFTNDELESGLANMTTALRDPEKAMQSMGLAADLARFKHISLADASTVVAKAMEGQLRPLKQLGIDLPVAAGGAYKLEQAHNALARAQQGVNDVLAKYPDAVEAASQHHHEYETATNKVAIAQAKLNDVQGAAGAITKGLTSAVGGMSEAYSGTYQGKIDTVRAKTENLSEAFGQHLLPAITSVVGAISDSIGWLEKHKTTAEGLAVVVGTGLAVVLGAGLVGALTSASEAFTLTGRAAALFGVEAAEGEAAATLPLLPWIALVAAVGFAAFELYKHWGAVWSGIKSVVSEGWNFLKQHFTLIMTVALGPLGFAIAELGKHWDAVWGAIKGAVSTAWGFLKPIFGYVVSLGIGVVKTEIQGLQTVWSTAWDAIKSVVSGVWDFLKPIFDKITSGVSGVVNAVSKVAGIAGKGVGAVEGFFGGGKATGGPISAGTAYLVGEHGPELIVPHSNGYVVPNEALRGGGHPVIGAGGGSSVVVHHQPIIVNVAGSVSSDMELADKLHTLLLQKQNRGGSLGFK